MDQEYKERFVVNLFGAKFRVTDAIKANIQNNIKLINTISLSHSRNYNIHRALKPKKQ